MLLHTNSRPSTCSRVVVLGASGFVGAAATRRLGADAIPVLEIPRNMIDLTSWDSPDALATMLRPADSLVIASAKAPVKSNAMLLENLVMVDSVCRALERVPVSHIVYISSDAVYGDQNTPLTEESCANPGSLHGVMHIAREMMLRLSYLGPLCILRPTLLYGKDDPHNGYGPNKFRRLAAEGKDIVLFGNGEERRDHVHIDDVAEVIRLVLLYRSQGVLNIATGEVATFKEIAEQAIHLAGSASRIICTPRTGPMPHNGYRAFDISACRKAFPDFHFTKVAAGLARVQREIQEKI